MENNVFHQNSIDKQKIAHRIELIRELTTDLYRFMTFRQSSNFDALLEYYSENLEEIYNDIRDISDQEFENRIYLLTQSINQIKHYAIN